MVTLPHSKIMISRLRAAAQKYSTTRKRRAVHDFLALVYELFWLIKRSPRVLLHASNLRKRAKLSAGTKMPLSSLLLNLASPDLDRRTLHRWKSLIEAAFERDIRPQRLRTEVVSRGGVNRALAHWRKEASTKELLPDTAPSLLSKNGSHGASAEQQMAGPAPVIETEENRESHLAQAPDMPAN